MKNLDFFAMVLLLLGGINWGLWGVFDFNLIDYVFGRVWIDRVLYFLIGVSGVYVACAWKSMRTRWASKRSKR